MKRAIPVIVSVLLLAVNGYAVAYARHTDFLIEKSLDMASLIQNTTNSLPLESNEAFNSDDMDMIEKIKSSDFSIPNHMIIVQFPMSALLAQTDMQSAFVQMEPDVKNALERRMAADIPRLINSYGSTLSLANTDMLIANNAYINPGIDEAIHVILGFTSDISSFTSFLPNENNVVILHSAILFNFDESLTQLEKAGITESFFSSFDSAEFVLEEMDAEAIKKIQNE